MFKVNIKKPEQRLLFLLTLNIFLFLFFINFEHILHCFSVSIVNLKRVFLFSKIGNHSVLFFPSNIWFEIFFASKLNT